MLEFQVILALLIKIITGNNEAFQNPTTLPLCNPKLKLDSHLQKKLSLFASMKALKT